MLIAHDGSYAGLLSGGCLETDLREHARAVIETGVPHAVTYDMGGTDDAFWGLGIGCEGAMRILLVRVGAENNWQPLEHLARALARHAPASAAILVESSWPEYPAGTTILPGHIPSRIPQAEPIQDLLDRAASTGKALWLEGSEPGMRVFALSLALPPRLLVLGAGPDAQPVVEFASRLGWKVGVYDHRPAYAKTIHFPQAESVQLGHSDEVAKALELSTFDAAVVMSHHLTSDLEYLRALAGSSIEYVGLLGPAMRRERLLSDLSAQEAEALRGKLRAPVGLSIGGRTPESIALSIVSEIHAYLHGREGGPFSRAVRPPPPNAVATETERSSV